jgi:hypothetical protein
MHTKGTSFLGRRSAIVRQFGEPLWNAYIKAYAQVDPFFAQPILATTQIPSEKFVAFNDRLIDSFFGGRKAGYWTFGEQSASWGLIHGPYKRFRTEGDTGRLLEQVPHLWSGYHDAGVCQAERLDPRTFEVSLVGVPIRHPYFELTLMGFMGRTFQLVTRTAHDYELVRGFTKGDRDIVFRLHARAAE